MVLFATIFSMSPTDLAFLAACDVFFSGAFAV